MRAVRIISLVLALAASAQPSWGQFIRPPVIIRPPIIRPPVHVPVHVPGSHQAVNRDSDGISPGWIFGGLAGLGGLIGGGYLVHHIWKRSGKRAIIRITSMPPGEAPAAVRQAWVGLEFPLIVGQTNTVRLAAQQVLSRAAVITPAGYAIEGRAAIEALQSASPESAQWWRDHAPDVLAPGYQLVFPAAVCERLDDMGGQVA